MKKPVSILRALRMKTSALFVGVLLALGAASASAQTYYNMSSGDYSENFDDIADTAAWPNGFNGTSSAEWRGLPVNATGLIPDGVRLTVDTSASILTGNSTSGGVQRGTNNILLLSTGATSENSTSSAIELYLNFTGRTAGTISYTAATVFNQSGNRVGTLRVYASVDGTNYSEIAGTSYVATNNVAGSASITNVALPATFNNAAQARLRFYYSNGTGGTTGSRPKISIDNLVVTSVPGGPEISIESPVSTEITSGGTRAYGSVQVGSNLAQVFRVKNTGGSDLSVTGITFGGVDAADFTLISPPSFPVTIAAAGQQDFTVRFAPGSTGSRAASVTFANSDSNEGTYLINLTGSGSAAPLPPTVTSEAATAIGTAGVTFNGTVNVDGGSPVTARGFAYSDTDTTPTFGEGGVSSLAAGSGVGAYSGVLATGLVPNTLYYYQAYATNIPGTNHGGVLNFTTLPNAPTVGTGSGATISTFTANWTAPSPAGTATFTYTVEVDDNSDFSSPEVADTGIASSNTSNLIDLLNAGTTYYYRVKAVNATGSSAWSATSAPIATTSNDVGLSTIGVAVTQNFDGLANTGTANTVLPSGWLFAEQGTNANSTYAADNMATTNSGNTYSLGATSSTDRAFGGLQSGSLIPTVGARIKNNTGTTIVALQISYTGETWRVGTADRVDRLNFQISTDATSLLTGNWSDVDELDYANPGQAIGSGSVQHTATVSHTITGLNIAPGETAYIRWSDFNASGADDAMGIDDFSVTPLDFVAAAPEIALSDGTNTIPNGGTDNVGNQNIGETVGIPYDIANNGDLDLTLGTVTVTGTTNASATVSTQPDSTVIPAGITSTIIDVTPTATGPWTVSLSVSTDDPDENPTTWTITGNGRSVTPISLATLNTAVTQNFDSLVNTGTSSTTPTGWFFEEAGTGANTTYGASDGSSSSGDTYSLGTTTPSSTERAFGALRVGTLTPTIGARLKNNTGSTITDLAIAYTGETWRVGAASRSDSLIFQISFDATSIIDNAATWTAVTQLDYSNPGGPAIAGGSLQHSAAIAHTLTSLNIPAGATFFIRWNDTDVTGADDAMGIDDFSITPSGGSSTAPEIALSADGSPIANGGTDSVGNLTFGVATPITYDIENTGDAALTLSAVTVSASTNAMASVTNPATSVAAAGTTSTVISVTPTAAGAWSVTLSIDTNDSDENPTTWTISGSGQSAFQTWTDGFDFAGGNSTATGDPNNDGINNLESYALDINPVAASGPRAKVLGGTDTVTAGGPWFTTTYRRSTTATGVTIRIRATNDLTVAPTDLVIDGTNVVQEIANADVDGDGSAELIRLRIKLSLATKRFFSLQVTQP